MIDPIQLPILMKALELVFDEGRRILDERRERKKEAATTPIAGEPDLPQADLPASNPEQDKAFRQDLIASRIDELLWRSHEEEIQHLVRLFETQSRNLHIAKEQHAKWGSALVPPIVLHNLTEAENSALETRRRLELVLSKVYQKDIPSHPE